MTTTVYSGTVAAKPAAGTAGDMYLPTDGVQIERDSGAAWVPWGPMFPCTPMVNGDFAWVNQGTATVDATYENVFLQAPSTGVAAHNLRIRVKSAPATPYSIVLMMQPNAYTGVGVVNVAGPCWRESASGKLITVRRGHQSTIYIDKWTDPTTFSANYVNFRIYPEAIFFVKLTDNGVNRLISYGLDGQHWIQLHSVGRTDFLTADQVGICTQPYHITVSSQLAVYHWKES